MNKKEQRRIQAERTEDWKCGGRKLKHGIRSSVPKTWDSRKGGRSKLATVAAKDVPSARLDSLAESIAKAQGWSYEFVRSRPPAQIVNMARKYL